MWSFDCTVRGDDESGVIFITIISAQAEVQVERLTKGAAIAQV